MKVRNFYIGVPQRVAALLLLVFLAECFLALRHESLDSADYRYAECGRQMWESPSALQGYFTTCGNLHGDGLFAYRLAGFPLTAQRLVLLGVDHLRKPENREYTGSSLNGTTWEARHQLSYVKYLLRLPFVLFAVWLGGGLWWVAKRLYGPEGGAFALALYIFSPAVIRYATHPNNEILAMWGLYGLIYTAIGVAHALQGPRHKWKPRIVLLTAALGLTAAAHLLAAMVGFVVGTLLFLYLSERRRSHVAPIMVYAALGGLVVEFAFFGFRPSAFLYVFTGGAGRFWFSLDLTRHTFFTLSNAGILIAAAFALVIYATSRPSRYFGNTAPLLMVLILMPLYTTQTIASPWFWALPFLFTFIGGIFADALESRQRKVILALTIAITLTQAALCWASFYGVIV